MMIDLYWFVYTSILLSVLLDFATLHINERKPHLTGMLAVSGG